jgi:hypothetical protein
MTIPAEGTDKSLLALFEISLPIFHRNFEITAIMLLSHAKGADFDASGRGN